MSLGRTLGFTGLGLLLGFSLGLLLDRLVGRLSLGSRRRGAYPVLEGLAAILFAAASLRVGDINLSLLIGAFLGVVATAGLIDARKRIIPNRLIFPSLAVFAVWIASLDWGGDGVSFIRGSLGLLALGGGLLVVSIVSPRGMGMGDVKLGGFIGLVTGSLGWRYLEVASFVGILAGGLAGVALLLAGRGRKASLPFGPSLAVGAIVAALFAPDIARWYAGLLR